MYFSYILSLSAIFVISFMIPLAEATDEYVKTTQEKIIVIKYHSMSPTVDRIQVNLINLNPTAINSETPRTFQIIKSDLIASNVDRLSFADKKLDSAHLKIVDAVGNGLGQKKS